MYFQVAKCPNTIKFLFVFYFTSRQKYQKRRNSNRSWYIGYIAIQYNLGLNIKKHALNGASTVPTSNVRKTCILIF
jgi:hypothetical protein